MKDRKAIVDDYPSCMECGACSLNCPARAITLTKGTGCLYAIIKEDILKISRKNKGCGCGCGILKGE
ncbi:MAG: 4Fe-4S binding protein [bacterium]|nr:4Fe-4S binding protein [bacterium]